MALATPSASCQGYAPSASLGGYGAASRDAMAGMGSAGPMIIPYGGTFDGFMPGRMGGGVELSFRSRPAAGPTRRSFTLTPPAGGMSPMSARTGASRSAMGRSRGTDLGGMSRMPRGREAGVMPPRIGYPFRQPPSLVPSSATAMGMSM